MNVYDFARLVIFGERNIKIRDFTGQLVFNVTAEEIICGDEDDWDYEIIGIDVVSGSDFLVVIG